MNIIISNSSGPLYQQIKEQIKDAILKGELTDGELLPSVRGFANDIGVSVLTIRRVYDDLEQEGFAVSQAGRGTFVSMGNPELLLETKRRMVEEDMQKAIHNAKLFGIAKEELEAMMNILYEEEDNE
ncbi:MAG: GntR family transcriptional regulator [Clostridiales bacterium]|nr:GntR family transcriptional regulator [Clostridiales bacterium]